MRMKQIWLAVSKLKQTVLYTATPMAVLPQPAIERDRSHPRLQTREGRNPQAFWVAVSQEDMSAG